MMRELQERLTEAAKENLSRDQILKILEERTQAAQHELACQTDAGADVLGYLAAHGGTVTRRAVAANVSTPHHANRLLCDDADDEVRGELCRKIARLMPDLSRQEALEVRTLVIEMLEKLARDQAPRVRAILAEEIKHLDCVPKSVVDKLSRDVEEIVAHPVLEYSPLLSDADLIEIIASAEAEHALAAIARRKPLSGDVSEAIVGSLDIPAIATLLANPHAAIREQTIDNLVATAENIRTLHLPLTLRTDLSARTLRRLASFVGADLLESLAARDGLDESTQVYLNRRLRARLAGEEVGDSAATEAAVHAVEDAARDGRLNEEFVGEAAEAGNKEIVIVALAALARVPLPNVRGIINSRSAKAVIALVWWARLSMRTAAKITSFVLKLVADDRLMARGGKGFPLTEDEMRWQLDYFGVPLPEAGDAANPSAET